MKGLGFISTSFTSSTESVLLELSTLLSSKSKLERLGTFKLSSEFFTEEFSYCLPSFMVCIVVWLDVIEKGGSDVLDLRS